MNIKPNLFYTKDHEWVNVEGDTATMGITDHAQAQLGSIVFVELPEINKTVKAGDTLGVVESTKAVSDFYSAVEGTVTAVNNDLNGTPESINEDPYGKGWLARLKFTKKSSELMDAESYEKYLNEEHK
ncbi:MAG: glycine cleavage system protein GcvH [Pseudomonadota bacterium]